MLLFFLAVLVQCAHDTWSPHKPLVKTRKYVLNLLFPEWPAYKQFVPHCL